MVERPLAADCGYSFMQSLLATGGSDLRRRQRLYLGRKKNLTGPASNAFRAQKFSLQNKALQAVHQNGAVNSFREYRPKRTLPGVLGPRQVNRPSRIILENNGKIRPRPIREKLFARAGGGGGGIRTHGTVSGTPVFKTGALNRSATPPSLDFVSVSGFAGPQPRPVATILLPNAFKRLALQRAGSRRQPARRRRPAFRA